MPGPLISAAELAAAVSGGSPPVVLDVRWRLGGPPGLDDYVAGHLPGACFVDLDRELSSPPGPGRHPMPDARAFGEVMRRCGVSALREVVAYDDGDGVAGSRAWWVLGYFGHGRVRVLDGGFRAWVDAGLPVTAEVPSPPPGDFEPDPGHRPMLDASGAASLAQRGILLDARTPERFRGEVEPVDPVAGRIPGARNAPTTANLDPETGRFRTPDELRRQFAALGVTPGDEVGAYCGSGVTAAHEVLALELAGIPAALYVGSWSEWITDPTRPIATGPE